MDGFKIVGIKRNEYMKEDIPVRSIELHLESLDEDVEGVMTSTCFVSDFRKPKLYDTAADLNIGDIIVPVKGQYSVEKIIVLSRA